MNIGFIGFGEAGYNIAKGLKRAGITRIFAFDINSETPKLDEKIKQRANETETILCASTEELANWSDVIFSTVTADSAIKAAEQNAPFLTENHFYADLNSVSPDTKIKIAQIVGKAKFVEVAVMAPVPPHGHKVPMYLGGKFAAELASLLTPFGMNLEVISENLGAAIAVKMCRSIIVKGLEALLLECVLGAVKYGADERVFATLDESFPMMKKWSEVADYMIGRSIEHGIRRSAEVREVAETLKSVGIEPIMADAIAMRQEWAGKLNLLVQFGGKDPIDYHRIVDKIETLSVEN